MEIILLQKDDWRRPAGLLDTTTNESNDLIQRRENALIAAIKTVTFIEHGSPLY